MELAIPVGRGKTFNNSKTKKEVNLLIRGKLGREIKKESILKPSSFYEHDNRLYYIATMIFPREIQKEFPHTSSYYWGTEILTNVNNDVVVMGDEILFEVSGDGLISIKKITMDMFSNLEYYYQLKQLAIGILDFDSSEGRLALLENILPKDKKLIQIEQPTLKFDSTFMRYSHDSKFKLVNLDQVVGTLHQDYEGKSWLRIYSYLKRNSALMTALTNPKYYDSLSLDKQYENPISFIQVDDKYYFVDGDGNHRTTMCKLLGKSHIYGNVTSCYNDYAFKSAYEQLSKLGFEIEFPKYTPYVYSPSGQRISYKWEVFKLKVENSIIELFGLEDINSFFEYYNDISPQSAKKKLFSILSYPRKVSRFNYFLEILRERKLSMSQKSNV